MKKTTTQSQEGRGAGSGKARVAGTVLGTALPWPHVIPTMPGCFLLETKASGRGQPLGQSPAVEGQEWSADGCAFGATFCPLHTTAPVSPLHWAPLLIS